MSTHYFSPVTHGTNNGVDSVNNPMGQLDAAIHLRYLQLLSAFNALIVDAGATNAETIAARTRAPYAGTAPANVGDAIENLGAGTINVMAAGATGDGTTDDSAAIQAAIDSVFEVIYFPPGDYVLETPIAVPANTTIICNNGVTILPQFSAGLSAFVIGGSNVVLRGLHITGAGTGFDNGIYIDLDAGNLRNIRIEQCEFLTMTDAIQIKALVQTGRILYDTWITDCRFENITQKCVDMIVSHGAGGVAYSMENIHIERNYFADCGEDSGKGGVGGTFTAIVYIGGLTSVTNFYLCDNICFRVSPQFVAMGADASYPWWTRRDFYVTGNTINQDGAAIVINMCYTFHTVENLIFANNTCSYVDYEHVYLANCSNFKVIGCHFSWGNIAVAVGDDSPGQRSYGEISDCTFIDCEAVDQGENSGNKAIFVSSDNAEINVSNCHFIRRDGTSSQQGIDSNYQNTDTNEEAMNAVGYDTVHYSWVSRGSSEYSLHSAAGGDPFIRRPVAIYENGVKLTEVAVGALAASQWTWGDQHTLGYVTVYVQLSDGAAPASLEVTAGVPRLGINITNCNFDRVTTGILIASGGTIAFPGHGKVINCTFKRCSLGVSFATPLGSVVMGCSFDSCHTDVRGSVDTSGLLAFANTHLNTNPTDSSGAGAYAIDTGADYNIWSVIGCTFRNVKRAHQTITGGSLSSRKRVVIWRDNNVDSLTTGVPSGTGVITMITNAQKYLSQNTAAPTAGTDWTLGDLVLNSEPSPGEEIGWVGTADTDYNDVLRIQASAHYLSGSGSPAGSVSATYIGQEYFATSAAHWWKATATGTGGWKQVTA